MNILHFSTDDITGGAAKATYRLHNSLRDAGHSSRMIVRNKHSDDVDVHQVPYVWPSRLTRLKRHIQSFGKKLPTASYTFNFDAEPDIDTQLFCSDSTGAVDIICLHWITNLLTVKTIRTIYDHYRCPIVWTLMDQEPFTGGCHYSFGCDGFAGQCGNCPQLNPHGLEDLSQIVWLRKQEHLQSLPITFVAVTNWLATRVRASSLFRDHRVELIPLPIDTTVFRPFDRQAARDLLHVPQGKKVIFFGAGSLEDPRKGMKYLLEALHKLLLLTRKEGSSLDGKEIFLLLAGRQGVDLACFIPFPSKHVGYLNNDIALALAYQAADIFVCPSTEDAGPMMIPESMLCGTPVVAFNTGGAPDLIETTKTGYLAMYKDSTDLANGIYALLTANNLPAMCAAASRIAIQNHSPSAVISRYGDLYASLERGN